MKLKKFLDCLKAQVEANRRILSLAQEEACEVDRAYAQGILEVQGQREQIFFELAALQEEVADLYGRLDRKEREGVRGAIEEARKEIAALVREVQSVDARNAAKIAQIQEAILEEIRGLHGGRQALVAYKSVGHSSPRFLDSTV